MAGNPLCEKCGALGKRRLLPCGRHPVGIQGGGCESSGASRRPRLTVVFLCNPGKKSRKITYSRLISPLEIIVMHSIYKVAILLSFAGAAASASAANLGSFNVNCNNAAPAPLLSQAITGNVGDTFTVVNASTPVPAFCFFSVGNNAIITPNPVSAGISFGNSQTFTIASAGTTTLSVTQAGSGTNFNLTVAAPAVAAVPTLQTSALMALVLLLPIFGWGVQSRRNQKK